MATETVSTGPEYAERFRYNPEQISDRLGGDHTRERIEEEIHTVDGRRDLAQGLHANVPETREQYASVNDLENHLADVSATLRQKDRAYQALQQENAQMKHSLQKVEKKGFFDSPWVKAIIIGLLAWWAYGLFRGNLHAAYAAEHMEAAQTTGELQTLQTEAEGALAPGFGEGLKNTPGGGGTGAGSLPSEDVFEAPSEGPVPDDVPQAPPV